MIKNPIQEVTNKLQYRAIGIVNGIYNPNDQTQLNKGTLTDNEGKEIETVVLGKAISLIKKYVDLKKSYYWIVYPKNKNTQNLHLQITGIWDPFDFNDEAKINSKKDTSALLQELNLTDNYFSIRGELIFVNTKKKELVIKIFTSKPKNNNNKSFKLVVEGEISSEILNSFVSLDVVREGRVLRMVRCEVVEKLSSKK